MREPILNNADTGGDADFLVVAEKENIAISVYRGVDVPVWGRAHYTKLADGAVSKHPALLKRLDPAAVFAEDTVVTLALRAGSLELAVYADCGTDDDGPYLFCKGLVSEGRVNGVVPALIAASFVGAARLIGCFPSGRAVARILPDDQVNIGSSLNFARAGFYAARAYSEKIELHNIQRAIDGSAECGADGLFTRALEMRGKAKDVRRRSIENLDGWTLKYGHLRL